jgi:hypothetical protein
MNKAFCELLGIEYRREFDIPCDDIPSDAKSDKFGRRNPNFGLKHSRETRKAISAARIGVNTNTEENCKKKKENWLKNNPNYNPESLKKSVDSRSKMYRVINPSGEEFIVKNMAEFCRVNNLHKGNMSAVAKGKLRHSKGWKCFYLSSNLINTFKYSRRVKWLLM